MWEEVGECGKEWYFFLSVGKSGKRGEKVGGWGLGGFSTQKNRHYKNAVDLRRKMRRARQTSGNVRGDRRENKRGPTGNRNSDGIPSDSVGIRRVLCADLDERAFAFVYKFGERGVRSVVCKI